MNNYAYSNIFVAKTVILVNSYTLVETFVQGLLGCI